MIFLQRQCMCAKKYHRKAGTSLQYYRSIYIIFISDCNAFKKTISEKEDVYFITFMCSGFLEKEKRIW